MSIKATYSSHPTPYLNDEQLKALSNAQCIVESAERGIQEKEATLRSGLALRIKKLRERLKRNTTVQREKEVAIRTDRESSLLNERYRKEAQETHEQCLAFALELTKKILEHELTFDYTHIARYLTTRASHLPFEQAHSVRIPAVHYEQLRRHLPEFIQHKVIPAPIAPGNVELLMEQGTIQISLSKPLES